MRVDRETLTLGYAGRLLQLPAACGDAPPTATASRSAPLLVEVGRRRLVGGQEDMLIDIALDVASERRPQPERPS